MRLYINSFYVSDHIKYIEKGNNLENLIRTEIAAKFTISEYTYYSDKRQGTEECLNSDALNSTY